MGGCVQQGQEHFQAGLCRLLKSYCNHFRGSVWISHDNSKAACERRHVDLVGRDENRPVEINWRIVATVCSNWLTQTPPLRFRIACCTLLCSHAAVESSFHFEATLLFSVSPLMTRLQLPMATQEVNVEVSERNRKMVNEKKNAEHCATGLIIKGVSIAPSGQRSIFWALC